MIYGIIVKNWVNSFPCERDVEIQLIIVCVVINYKNYKGTYVIIELITC